MYGDKPPGRGQDDDDDDREPPKIIEGRGMRGRGDMRMRGGGRGDMRGGGDMHGDSSFGDQGAFRGGFSRGGPPGGRGDFRGGFSRGGMGPDMGGRGGHGNPPEY